MLLPESRAILYQPRVGTWFKSVFTEDPGRNTPKHAKEIMCTEIEYRRGGGGLLERAQFTADHVVHGLFIPPPPLHSSRLGNYSTCYAFLP